MDCACGTIRPFGKRELTGTARSGRPPDQLEPPGPRAAGFWQHSGVFGREFR